MVADGSDFARATPSKEAALETFTESGHGAGESDASRYSVRVGHGRSRKKRLCVRM
jgi:hypothetical protein